MENIRSLYLMSDLVEMLVEIVGQRPVSISVRNREDTFNNQVLVTQFDNEYWVVVFEEEHLYDSACEDKYLFKARLELLEDKPIVNVKVATIIDRG